MKMRLKVKKEFKIKKKKTIIIICHNYEKKNRRSTMSIHLSNE